MSGRPLAGMRVAVTGGTGFLGRHLLPALLAAGATVTCIARPSSDTSRLPGKVRVALADLEHGTGLAEILAGQDALIHMAALLFGLGWQDYLESNARAARSLARAICSLPERPHVTLVSSLAATGPCGSAPGAAENSGLAPVSAYGWSKLLCERIFSGIPDAFPAIVRPPIIYGSGDRGLLPVFRAAARGLGISPGLGRDFPVSLIHASDVARAIVLLCERRASGIYHVNDGAIHDMASFCRAMGRAQGRANLRVLRVPLPVMGACAWLSGAMASALPRAVMRGAPGLNPDKYREARAAGWLCDASRIAREHGFAPAMPLERGLEEAVAGYRGEGWL